MVDLVASFGRFGVALVLVALNGFFVASEFAYVRVRATSVEQFVEEGRSGAAYLQDAMENLDDYLAVTQLGITLSSLSLGWIGEPAVAALIEPLLGSVLPSGVIHITAVVIGFSVVTFLHVVFGELAPKTIAIAQAERVALLVAAPMRACYYLFIPGIVVFNGTANFFTRLIGVPPASESEEILTEKELRSVLAKSGQAGHVDAEEVEMIERVFELDDVTVKDVMVPRPDVISVSSDTPLSDLRAAVVESGHTRYPVVDTDDGDRVTGFVDAKDLVAATASGADEDAETTAADVARDVPVVPETTSVTDLLAQFQSERRQMAVVIDEWGAFEGIATVEDVVEEVVGDLRDEFDGTEPDEPIGWRGRGSYTVDGGASIDELNEELGSEFDLADVGTVGGLVLAQLGRAPEAGDSVSVEGYEFEVDAVDGNRITSVVVYEPDETDESAT